jgi:tetratricopeptide (TPR) repeat protein/tRNA A-37 threonylcarbamoyl transferase component Bud32
MDARVIDLLLHWEELHEQGCSPTPEELCRECPELVEEVRRRIGGLGRLVPLVHAAAASAETIVPQDPPACSAAEEGSAGRYRLVRFHAHGGLGEVFLARDEELSRDVALKRMRRDSAGRSASRSRFLREAEITGGLEHPGVVPVYGLTRDAAGQPCYAMRFVRGQTLQEALQRFHHGMGAGTAGRALALRQLLGRFVAVCNTVAYAHSKGVIHRDLKPHNVMLGDYGETLVIDWGLARRLNSPESASLPETVRSTEEGPELTRTGEALGTLVYMSPEQAAGRHGEVGPASDVYGLGATLYAVLTGRPPFTGDNVASVLRQVQAGQFPPPRVVRPGTPRPLEAVCLKALAVRPEDRYATALDLAADVERWLADEPVRAYPEPLRLRLGRWARRHRAAVQAAMAAIGVAVVLGALGAWWLDRQQTERRREVEGALAEVARLQGHARWTEAQAILGQAQTRLGDGGPADLRQRLEEARADLKMVVRLDELRQWRASWVETEDFLSHRDYVEALRKVLQERGLAVDAESSAVLLGQVQASAVKDGLVAALDEWAWFAPEAAEKARLLAVARQADPHPWRDRFRDPAVRTDGQALRRLADQAPLSELSPFLLVIFAAAQGRAGGDQEAFLRQAQQLHPGDFWINFDLAWVLSRQPPDEARLAEEIGFYRAALAARPNSSLAWTNLGASLERQGKLAEAEAAIRKAIRLQGDNAMAHLNLSFYLNKQKRYAEAEAVCREFIKRVRPDYHRIYLNLCVALENRGDLEGARAACDRAISLQRSYARSWLRRASVLFQQKNYPEAERDYREAFRLDPRSAESLIGVVDSLRTQRKLAEAETFCRNVLRASSDFAPAHLGLAGVRTDQGKLADAETHCRKAISLWPEYALAYSALGYLLYEQERLPEAIAAHRKAVRLAPDDGGVHVNCAASLRQAGLLDEAELHCRKAILLRPKWDDPYFHLGLVQLRQGMLGPAPLRRERFSRAETSFRKALELDPGRGHNHVRLGDALKNQGQFTAALKAYRRGDELGRKEPGWPSYIGTRIREAEELVAVEERLASSLKEGAGSPNLPLLTVAQLHGYKQHYAAAARCYVRAFEAQPKLAEDPANRYRYSAACFALLASGGQGEDAARLTAEERAGWRRQALDWLRGDLKQWTKKLANAAPRDRGRIGQALRDWQRDSDLAAVRDVKALGKLVDPERSAWKQLWAEVAALLRTAIAPSGPSQK